MPMTPEEIEEALVEVVKGSGKDADKIKALEALARIKGLIKHGNAAKEKDFRDVIIGRKGIPQSGGNDEK